MLLNCSVIKILMNRAFALKCLSNVPDDFQDNVNDSNVGVNESIFSLLYAQ